MKIYYDYQVFILQKYGGISRYFYELYTRINKKENCAATINCCHNTNHYFADIFHSEYPVLIGKKWTFYNKLNKLITWFNLRKHYDIVHPTYYSEYILKCLRKDQKLIVTIYDMIHEKFHDKYPDALPTTDIAMKKEMIYKSDHIIAISQSTKNDILEYYPDIPEDKISVIYLGTQISEDKKITVNKDFPQKYVLFVGQRKTYKNFDILLSAMKEIMDNDKDIFLICMGGGKFDKDELSLMESYKDRIIQKDCDDYTLTQAYRQALCFVFPSLYEGFGIPTLEAFENECPAIISNTSSMPEVGGDAALYFDPINKNQLKEQIYKLINDNELRKTLINKGKERLKLFQWEDKVEEVIACYNKVRNTKTEK